MICSVSEAQGPSLLPFCDFGLKALRATVVNSRWEVLSVDDAETRRLQLMLSGEGSLESS